MPSEPLDPEPEIPSCDGCCHQHDVNWLDLVRKVFPNANNDEAGFLLWNRTGYPAFWTGNPAACATRQLRRYKSLLAKGKPPCDFCDRVAKLPKHSKNPSLCGPCSRALNKDHK